MNIADSVIDPATAELDVWAYVVALKDDDWDHWDSAGQMAKYNGCRRGATGRWNLRDLVTGSPIDWSYADDEVVVLQVIGNDMESSALGDRDPAPWVHVSGVRVSDPAGAGAPKGGYTYSPRAGYADYPDRYISTRKSTSKEMKR